MMVAMAQLHAVEASELHARRERVFLVLAGIFLGSMTLLNILDISRFIDQRLDQMKDDGQLNDIVQSYL